MARLYKPTRKDGSVASVNWWFDFVVHGRRYRGSTHIRDKKLASKYVDNAQAKVRLGMPLDGPRRKDVPTFSVFADAYLKGEAANRRSKGSIRSIVNRALLPFFGKKRLDEITLEQVEGFRDKRLRGELNHEKSRKPKPAPRTVEAELATLHRILTIALRRGHVDRNPAAQVNVEYDDNGRDRVISPAEQVKLLAQVNEDYGLHMRPMLILAYETGMRMGEIRVMRWADVDFARHVYRVPRSKNGKPRLVPLSEAAEKALQAPIWWRRDSSYVFPAKKGEGYLGSVSHVFARMAERAEVQGVRFHDYRHTFCTRMTRQRGVNIITLQEITGHQTLDMLKRYSHPSAEDKVALVRGTADSLHTEEKASEGVSVTR